jgi:hypothetical protein
MKRTAFAIIVVLAVTVLAAPALAGSRNDFKVIQNAVKSSPAAETGREAKWFKVLITDNKSNEAKVKVTLPVALIEAILACTDGRHFKVHDDNCEIDLKAIWAALKKAGPMALVEIEDDGAVIKVWLE